MASMSYEHRNIRKKASPALPIRKKIIQIMRSHLAALLLVLLVKIGIVGASGTSLHEGIAYPKAKFSAQDASVHLDDLHHLECQLNISRQHDTLNTLRGKAHFLSESFDQESHLLSTGTLENCVHVYMDMTGSEVRSFQAQLSDWAPAIFNSPTEHFLNDGQLFLNGLKLLEHKALDLAHIHLRISHHVLTLKESCQGILSRNIRALCGQ